jgi:hypothetical protein
MLRTTGFFLGCWAAFWIGGCGSTQQELAGEKNEAPQPFSGAAESQKAAKSARPKLEVSHSKMADLLHLLEGVSLWQEGAPRILFKTFDSRFGQDRTDRELMKKYAFLRSDLSKKSKPQGTDLSFEQPFGSEGLFPPASMSLQDRFMEVVLGVQDPSAVAGSLSGILDPADAEIVSAALQKLAPRVLELTKDPMIQVEALNQLLQSEPVMMHVESFARFVGVAPEGLLFKVHVVWAPPEAPFEATAYGDRIVVTVPEGKPVGATHAALVVHEIGRRILARIPAETKALCTMRFVEQAGYREEPFLLVEGMLDAFSHGLVVPKLSVGEVPPWPGDAARKKLAEAITPLLDESLKAGGSLDGGFALKVGEMQLRLNPPKPSDFVNALMVVAEEESLVPVKSQVVRWAVWKFPPSKKYDYPKKLDLSPGRSVLFVLSPQDLEKLPQRFAGMESILAAFQKAKAVLGKKGGVIVSAPRESRGYYFLLAARSQDAMKQVAKKFFSLDRIPQGVLEIE